MRRGPRVVRDSLGLQLLSVVAQVIGWFALVAFVAWLFS